MDASMREGLAEEIELPRRLRQYIVLRWIAVAAIIGSVVLAQQVFDVQVPAAPLFQVAFAIALLNSIFFLWANWEQRAEVSAKTRVRRGRIFAHAQIIADLVALTVLIHLTGGIENPFFLFYLIHVGLGNLLLPARDMVWVTALASGLFAGLVAGEYWGWLPHIHLGRFFREEMYRESAYVAAVLVAFTTTLGVVSGVALNIASELRRRRQDQMQAHARELEQARDQLAELDRMRTFFLGLASHDLKTPLAVAVNFVQTILDGYAGEIAPKQRHWLERTLARLEELLQLINDFLDVSLLDAQRIAQEMVQTDLAVVAQQALEDMDVRAKEKGVNIESIVPPALPTLRGSPKRLRRLLVNLLDNGIKFTPPGGQVTLIMAEECEHIRIEVTDTGVGIPASRLPHIFEDYFRVREREFIPGAGLGLSTARRIVEAHGGKIWVESPYCADHSGSKFSCTLPKVMADGKSD
jgi:signal transduction histidine kinase